MPAHLWRGAFFGKAKVALIFYFAKYYFAFYLPPAAIPPTGYSGGGKRALDAQAEPYSGFRIGGHPSKIGQKALGTGTV